MLIDLKCWHCGKTATIDVPEPPQFAFQIAGWADDIGWRCHIEMHHGRSLVFCSDEHADAERTKAGHFRARPKRANVEFSGTPVALSPEAPLERRVGGQADASAP